jgi:prepilin-type processing-associated H-X9-DG protein
MLIEAEAGRAVHWMCPTDIRGEEIVNLVKGRPSPHPGGANAVMVDGRVHFLSSNLKEATLQALISIDGGDDAIAAEGH